MAITSDWLTRPLELKSDARYIVVVEKDGVFNRMVEDGFHDRWDISEQTLVPAYDIVRGNVWQARW